MSNINAELKKLRAMLDEYTKPPSILAGYFTPEWPGNTEDPLRALADFDLVRLATLLELPERSNEQEWEVALRLSIAAVDGLIAVLPPSEMLLSAIKAQQQSRADSFPMGRHQIDNRPHPEGGPGSCSAGLYHVALDPRITWDAPPVDFAKPCAICIKEGHSDGTPFYNSDGIPFCLIGAFK